MKRSERLIEMTQYFLDEPYALTPLKYFSKKYESSKSTISEDLEIIKGVFERRKAGHLITYSGATGGVRFKPGIPDGLARKMAMDLTQMVLEENRILPGGYIYLSDILGHPDPLKKIGQIIAHEFEHTRVDAVLTIATKGIPIAQSVAEILKVPFSVVRRDPKVTEGAMINVNYMSGSSSKVENMTVSKRSLTPGQQVLIVDDFMKGGGTLNGMKSIVYELNCQVAGVAVFVEGPFRGERPIDDYRSILQVDNIDLVNRNIDLRLGNIFEERLF